MPVNETRKARVDSKKSVTERKDSYDKQRDESHYKACSVGHKKRPNSSTKVSIEWKRPAEIVIDSGASEYVVYDSSFLINAQDVPSISVELANGTRASSTLR